MKIAYRLKEDSSRIAAIQKATLTTNEFGIQQSHGLLGSTEWWQQISSGKLPTHTLRGVIAERFMGSMNDWPEITVKSDSGELSHWTREVNVKEQDGLCIPGQRIEIDYVLQRHRPKSFDKGGETEIVLEIRVEPKDQSEGGFYEKLRARELAQAVTRFYPTIIDASRDLREVGKVPGVMDVESHRTFCDVAGDIEKATMSKRGLDDVLNRWRTSVLAACKKLLEAN